MDFTHLINKQVMVNFVGGREVVGILKSFDQVSNLVLQDAVEVFRDPEDIRIQTNSRELGVVIVRGPNVKLIN
jgi:U6 snRNA-associated Sm-like protein LSm7